VHVPPREPRALARALRELLADRTALDSFGIAGRDRALSRYSWPRIAASTAAVYRDVLAGHGAVHEPDLAGAVADGWDR